jgi:NAD(P)-dependent dehydrogenase (short-subunit alcohol dehydrogenase family)
MEANARLVRGAWREAGESLIEPRGTNMTLNGKVALVTGAASGIGRACALALAEAGAQVVVADINAAGAQATVDAIAAFQRRALAVPTDVGDLGQIDNMVKQALEAFCQIDILVNNAGVTRRADIMELTEADWDRIHRVNAKGVFFCLQRVAREMIPKRSGRIINIAAIAG